MAIIEKIPVAIYRYVMSQLAKSSGIIPKATSHAVEFNSKQIIRTLENMGLDVSKIKSTKDVQKYLNMHESWMKQMTKKGPHVTDKQLKKGIKKSLKDVEMLDPIGPFSKEYLTEGLVKDIPEWTKGFKPKVIQGGKGIMNTIESRMDKINKILADEKKLKKEWDELYGGKKPLKGNINYEKMEEKLGIKLLRNENLDELIEIEKRIKEGTFPRHQRRYDEAVALEDSKIAKDKYHIPDIIDPEDFAGGGLAGMLGEPAYADGGRTGFGKGKLVFDAARRKFLEMIGGAAAGVGVAKSGLFNLLKAGKPTATIVEQVAKDAAGTPNYIGSLIEVIKAKGTIKEIGKKGHRITEYKGVHLEEGPGIKTISKKSKNKETFQEIHEGEEIVKDQGLDTQKVVRSEDEYFGATTKSGKTTESISTKDHKELEKIADEIRNMVPDADEWRQPIRFDKASGGRVPLAGGKKALDVGIAYLKKKFGKDIIKKGSELKRPESALIREMFQNFNKELKMREMIEKKYKGVIDDKLLNQILTDDNPQRIAEVMATIDEALIMQGKGMGPETIMTTLRDSWKRKKNATGGLAGMLGE